MRSRTTPESLVPVTVDDDGYGFVARGIGTYPYYQLTQLVSNIARG